MASVQEGPSSKKSLNADMNLVPFIDFLSICICFLLMTAVWVQIANIEVKQAFGTAAQANQGPKTEVVIEFKSLTQLTVTLKEQNKSKQSFVVNFQGSIQKDLVPVLEGLGKKYQIQAATITTSSLVTHERFVEVLDSLRSQGILDLGVNHGV